MENKDYDKLKNELCCGFLDTGEFKKAFDVTKIAKNKSYRNQGPAVVGDAALKLLLTERVYSAVKSKKDINDERTAYESDENWIKFCNCFSLQKYRFAEGNETAGLRQLPGSKAIKAAFIEAVSGIIYLCHGMEKLAAWYDSLIETHGDELQGYGFKFLRK